MRLIYLASLDPLANSDARIPAEYPQGRESEGHPLDQSYENAVKQSIPLIGLVRGLKELDRLRTDASSIEGLEEFRKLVSKTLEGRDQ